MNYNANKHDLFNKKNEFKFLFDVFLSYNCNEMQSGSQLSVFSLKIALTFKKFRYVKTNHYCCWQRYGRL